MEIQENREGMENAESSHTGSEAADVCDVRLHEVGQGRRRNLVVRQVQYGNGHDRIGLKFLCDDPKL